MFWLVWLTCMSLSSTAFHSLLVSARSWVMFLFLLNWICLALDWFDIPCWARCMSCLWMHTCLRLDVAHIFVSLNASLTPPALHSLHSIYSGGVSASGGALGLFRLDVCMCQQGGEFWEKWSNKGETCLIFEKLVVHRVFESASFWESCTCEREKLCLGSFCFVIGSGFSSFSLCFLHDCVERYLCLWGVMFWLLIDCVEPLPLS